MSEGEAKQVKTPKKKTSKPKKPATHPKYSEMVAKVGFENLNISVFFKKLYYSELCNILILLSGCA